MTQPLRKQEIRDTLDFLKANNLKAFRMFEKLTKFDFDRNDPKVKVHLRRHRAIMKVYDEINKGNDLLRKEFKFFDEVEEMVDQVYDDDEKSKASSALKAKKPVSIDKEIENRKLKILELLVRQGRPLDEAREYLALI